MTDQLRRAQWQPLAERALDMVTHSSTTDLLLCGTEPLLLLASTLDILRNHQPTETSLLRCLSSCDDIRAFCDDVLLSVPSKDVPRHWTSLYADTAILTAICQLQRSASLTPVRGQPLSSSSTTQLQQGPTSQRNAALNDGIRALNSAIIVAAAPGSQRERVMLELLQATQACLGKHQLGSQVEASGSAASKSLPLSNPPPTTISSPALDGNQAASNKRVRHLASIHLRNFRPNKMPGSGHDPQGLFDISLGIASAAQQIPFCLTEPAQACVNADWAIDPGYLLASRSPVAPSAAAFLPATSSASALLGSQTFTVSVWASQEARLHSQEPTQNSHSDEGWAYCWQREIDMRKLERIPTGLASPVMRRLPANSLLLGLRSSIWRQPEMVKGDGAQALPRPVEQADGQSLDVHPLKGEGSSSNIDFASTRIAALHASQDIVTYYLVPRESKHKPHQLRRRSFSSAGTTLTEEEDVGASEPEVGGPSRDSDENLDQDGGYDSESAFELSSSALSPRKSGVRPGLERRTSSSRTVRALRKGRRKRTPSITEEPAPTDASGTGRSGLRLSSDVERQEAKSSRSSEEEEQKRRVQSWQLEREREQEVVERSKRETKMLRSYDRNSLEAIVRLQLELAKGRHALAQERDFCGSRLTSPSQGPALIRQSSAMQGKLKTIEGIMSVQSDSIRQFRGTMADKKDSFARRRARLELVKRQLQNDMASLRAKREEHITLRYRLHRQNVLIHNRRAQLLDTLLEIYPIRLISPSELLLSICQIALPNSPATALLEGRGKVDEEGVAAALGLAAQMVLLLSSYLDTSVHYEIAAAGSRAMIRDGISLMNGPRGFPLYSKGAEPYRFEYAVFLLNKNIEQLMNAHNLPVLDLRHTLPNLNNLTLTLSSPKSLDRSDTSQDQSAALRCNASTATDASGKGGGNGGNHLPFVAQRRSS